MSELSRRIPPRALFFLVVANMVGTGIFTTSGFIMADVQSPWLLLLCWALGGVVALLGGLSYAELGTRIPQAGGEYVFLRESFGPRAAFLAGWVSLFVGFAAPTAAAATALGTHVVAAFSPQAAHPGIARGLAIAVVVLLTLVHARGLGVGTRLQALLTVLKLALIVAFVVAGLLLGQGSWANFDAGAAAGPAAGLPWAAVATSLVFVSYAYTGWNAAVYVAGEIAAPARELPRAILLGTATVMLGYLLLNLVFVYALSPVEMAGASVQLREDVGLRAAVALFGPSVRAPFVLALGILLSSTIGAMTLVGPRVVYAMAKDGAFLPAFAHLDPHNGTPARAVLWQGALAVAMILTATFEALILYTGLVLAVFSSLAVVGLVRLRRRLGQRVGPVRRAAPFLFLLMNAWIVVFAARERASAFFVSAATLIVGYALACWVVRAAPGR